MNAEEVKESPPEAVALPPISDGAAQQPAQPPAQLPAKTGRARRRAFLIFFVVLILAAIGAVLWWLQARQFESTDDAQVDAHLNPVTARVDGTITHVYADDNQLVKVGAPLVDLDPRDFQVSLDGAMAQLSQARSLVVAERPNLPITEVSNLTNISGGEADVLNAQAALSAAERDRDTAFARVAEAEATDARAQADWGRYKVLISKEEVSQQEYDQIAYTAKSQTATLAAARSALLSAERTVDGRRAQLAQMQSRLVQYQRNAPQQVAISRARLQSNRASEQNAQAALENAQLKLSYAKVTAPVDGIIMRRSAEVGSHVSAGQQLMQIAQIHDIWITANFKETQLRNIHPQQSATIHVDALRRDFEGYVETIGGSTGSIASVLPPENATGNFVKVVQRIPVRIRFKPNQQGLERLRPGMSVEPDVRIGE